ncbi:MAG TPA: ATP-binding cassette domain-containing protein, partial [Thermoanaerobaculia bacterium]|nr:ATP-binding cassette domain-containing protein [Thermoanaerobaculia bacterium]
MPLMRLSHITKRFGANVAVDDVSLDFAPGEIVGLVGENGAGKTTLMSIAAGELAADAGTIEDRAVTGVVHQHFLLVSEFTIAENLALAMWGRDAEETIRASGIELRDVQRRIADLSVGEKAKLELIKAIARHPRFLILDEPTSVLAPTEARELFDVMRRLAAAGTTIVFISHKIPEVLEVATRIVVMRRGSIVADGGAMTAEQLAETMVERRNLTLDARRSDSRRSDSLVRPALAQSSTTGALSMTNLPSTGRTGESDLR